MRISITNAGLAALEAGTGPILLTKFELGSASGYIPDPTDTSIHGTLIYTGVPSTPIAVDPNTIKYSMYLDYNLGPFDFGEVGLYMQDGTLFALGAADVLIHKEPIAGTLGNSILIDAYLSMVDSNYTMWFDTTDTANPWRMGVFGTVDRLPQSFNASPNAYIISGASSTQSAFMAYTDRNGLWNFDCYQYSTGIVEFEITGVSSLSVTIDISQYSSDVAVSYFGERILEFITGPCYSFCRYVKEVGTSASTATLSFATPLALLPNVGDKFRLFSRTPLANTNIILPIATETDLGGIIVGPGLDVDATGLTSVDTSTIPGGVVVSVNGKQGAVNLQASDIPGSVLTVNSTPPDANGNVNVAPYNLPIASATTLGGVRIPNGGGLQINPTNGNLTIAGGGFVNSVNGRTGAVTIIGLVDPADIAASADLNTFTTPGLYATASDTVSQSLVNPPTVSGSMLRGSLEVIPLEPSGTSGDVVQRWEQQGMTATRVKNGATWGAWVSSTNPTVPIATTSSLGVVRVGTGLNITGTGILSTQIQSINGSSDQNIVLTADDVSAVSVLDVDRQSGVPGLGTDPALPENPTDSEQALSDFIYRRIHPLEVATGTWVNMAQWDAAANTATVHDIQGDSHTRSLQPNGQITDVWDLEPTVTFTADANGEVYEVTTSGTTNLDGITQWDVGDLALSLNGKWIKLNSTKKETGSFTLNAGLEHILPVPAGFDGLTCLFSLKIESAGDPTSMFDASAVATVKYSATEISITNNSNLNLNFHYVMRP